MKSISRPVFVCAVFISFLVFTTWCDLAYGARFRPTTTISYAVDLVSADMRDILSINDKGSILIERQLVPLADPVPLVIGKNGKETPPFQCPGTTNDTTGEGFNNLGEIVGHCGHQPGFTVMGFLANPKSGSFSLFAFPGAIATWAFAVNDFASRGLLQPKQHRSTWLFVGQK
jgi:hypothetical protein